MSVTYPYLPEGRNIKYVPADNLFMKEAMEICIEGSTDDQQPTGAVVVKNNKIIGKGANQTPIKHEIFKKMHARGLCVRKILKIKTGEKYWLCPGCSGYDTHAEARAVKDVLKHHFDTTGADLYLWGHWWCCKPCWDKMIKANIANVFLLEGSEVFFNKSQRDNRLGRQKFHLFLNK